MNMKQLKPLFKELNKQGFYARQKIACCNTCSLNLIPDVIKYVYTHEQDYNKSNIIHLGWGEETETGLEICKIARKQGFKVKWNRSPFTKIELQIKEGKNLFKRMKVK